MKKLLNRWFKREKPDTEFYQGLDWVLEYKSKKELETSLYFAKQNKSVEYFGNQFRMGGKHYIPQTGEDGVVKLMVKQLPADKPFSDVSLSRHMIDHAFRVYDVKKQEFLKIRLENENVYQ